MRNQGPDRLLPPPPPPPPPAAAGRGGGGGSASVPDRLLPPPPPPAAAPVVQPRGDQQGMRGTLPPARHLRAQARTPRRIGRAAAPLPRRGPPSPPRPPFPAAARPTLLPAARAGAAAAEPLDPPLLWPICGHFGCRRRVVPLAAPALPVFQEGFGARPGCRFRLPAGPPRKIRRGRAGAAAARAGAARLPPLCEQAAARACGAKARNCTGTSCARST